MMRNSNKVDTRGLRHTECESQQDTKAQKSSAIVNAAVNAFRQSNSKVNTQTSGNTSVIDTDRLNNESPATNQNCLHHIFEQQVSLTPDNIALECADRFMTYAEVDAIASRMASYLVSIGVTRETFVGISLDRSEWSIISILAVLKAGGAYVPVEPSLPDDRIRYISEESDFVAIITDNNNKERIQNISVGRAVTIEYFQAISHCYSETLTDRAQPPRPEDVCYVLFTSGTTGRPKGVMTEHRNAVHFVHAFNEACFTTQDDRIFQGFSLGFDGSVEEMWMAFSNGVTLVCGDTSTPRFGVELGQFLDEQRISFFSTVPTLLSTFTYDLPYLKQLVVSGEACHPDIVQRWATGNRVMLNVYGPTEATVNTTASILRKDEAVTIGRPLRGYDIYILDEDLLPVSEGEKGELYIGGPSISRGYLNQPDLTANAYIDWDKQGIHENIHPIKQETLRLYKTGDLVRLNEEGELEFFGRIDSQVKLRGFRVELSEIEAVLLEQPEIGAVTVQVIEHNGIKTLVGYVLLEEGIQTLDRVAVLEILKDRLPTYMIPSYLDVLETFPRLASGKVDRKQLPSPQTPLIVEVAIVEDNSSELENSIADIWAKHFGISTVGMEQDFFTDLGGHSLLAAQVIGTLHETLGQKVSIRDLYRYPTVRKLAYLLNKKAQTESQENNASHPDTENNINAKWPWWSVAIQSIYFLVIFPILALPLMFILPVGLGVLKQQNSLPEFALISSIVFGATWVVLILTAIAAKWLLIGRYKPGRYPLWGSFYIRWWIVSRLQFLSGISIFNDTPLGPVLWRLMGAKVGKGCSLNPSLVYAWDCVKIDDHVSVGKDTQMPGLRVENGQVIVGEISIESNCFIGCHSTLGLNVKMEENARLDDQSYLPDGEVAEKNAQYRGYPPEHATVPVPQGRAVTWSKAWLVTFFVIQLVTGIILTMAALAPIFVTSSIVALLAVNYSVYISVPAFLISVPLALFTFAIWTAFLRKAIRPNPQPGVYELYSFTYLQHWLSSLLMQLVQTVCSSVFTTLYLPPLMRLLGARLGKHTEMSTVWRIDPEMLTAGDGVFFADGSMMGLTRTHLGRFQVGHNTIGNNSFIGNSAILSTGNRVGNNCLLGVLSSVPDQMEPIEDNSDWLGSPSFRLPNRQKTFSFDKELTFNPTRKLYLQRAVIDALRVVLPGYVLGGFGIFSLLIVMAINETYGLWGAYTAIALLPWMVIAMCFATVLGLKWSIMGVYKPVVVPLWCRYVWWNELINGMYESLMAPWISNFFGTPFAAVLLRMMGCRVGKYCYIETDLFSEFDLVDIGDYTALNAGAIIQNHLFEDRIMKSSYIKINEGCSVGNMSVVLYDSVMEKGAVLAPMSLLMKGEKLSREGR